MIAERYKNIADVRALFREASVYKERVARMSLAQDGEGSRADPAAISALVGVAEKLGVIDRFSRVASGVVFLHEEDEILSGERGLKQTEAQAVLGFVVNQAKRQLGRI